jgi:O-antigen/teichoic acid export membrane protein
VSGVLAYVFFALVTRALDAEAAAPVAVLWSYWSFAAAALTFPLQHWIVRVVAASGGLEGPVRQAMRSIPAIALGAAVLAGLIGWVARDALFHDPGWQFPMLVVLVTLGSAFLGLVRGILTARHRLMAVGLALVGENALRCVVAAALMASDVTAARYYGLALAAGQLIGFAWPATLRLGREGPRDQSWVAFVAGASGGQVIAQVLLTGGPIALAFLGGAPAEVTGIFAALALFRAPYTLALGAVSPATGALTRLVVAEERETIRRLVGGLVGLTLLGVGVAAAIGALAGPALLHLVFGASVDVEPWVCLLIAVGCTLSLGALALSLVAMAHNRAHVILRSWLAAAATAGIVLVVGPGSPLSTVTIAFLAAEAVGFAALLATEVRQLRR